MNDTRQGEKETCEGAESPCSLARVQQTGIYESTSIQGDTRHYIGQRPAVEVRAASRCGQCEAAIPRRAHALSKAAASSQHQAIIAKQL